ncbi:hypothetical protein J6590_063361 [Homalodisca vitripennis]|nr:hypothetical protein J6590_063361 [Homalodisca vitripennis]
MFLSTVCSINDPSTLCCCVLRLMCGVLFQAKQRASVKWLLSKAYNNRVPETVKEPFYRDHEDQEHLKPQLVHSLANAELYCQALSNIYSDPNYHNLNNWGVLQVLARKGIYINDAHLTETVLIQTNPIKLGAHVSVMEALMALYAKEVATPDRVLAAVQRFSQSHQRPLPADHEQALLLWVNEANLALRERIQQEAKSQGDVPLPELKRVSDLNELCDGVSLAGLIAFYCPEELPWRSITVNKVPTVSDRVRNLMLVHDFCLNSLPFTVFHMMPEDISYMRGSMRPNLIVFLADMFNVLEIHPAKCVRFDKGAALLTEVCPKSIRPLTSRRPRRNRPARTGYWKGGASLLLPILVTALCSVQYCHMCALHFNMTERVEQRICIKFCQKLGHSASEMITMIRKVYGDVSMGDTQIKEWFRRFNNGRISVERL